MFGFGGLSSDNQKIETDSSKWEMQDDRYAGKFIANTGATGITHTIPIDNQTINRKNIYNQKYDLLKGATITNYQNGIIPVLNYKVEW